MADFHDRYFLDFKIDGGDEMGTLRKNTLISAEGEVEH